MSITIHIPDELSAQLEDEARRRGVEPQQFAVEIIRDRLPPVDKAKALRSLFDQWAAEDATDDPAEIMRRREEWAQLKRALNENRTSGPKLFADSWQNIKP